MRHRAPLLIALLAAACGAAFAQSSISRRPTLEAPADETVQHAARSATTPIDVPAEGEFLVPIPPDLALKGMPIIRADSGRELAASGFLVRVRSAPPVAVPSPDVSRAQDWLTAWMGPEVAYEIEPLTPSEAQKGVAPARLDEGWSLVALVRQPERRTGDTLVVGTRRHPVRWLAPLSPRLLSSERHDARDALLRAEALTPLLSRLRNDPQEHFRLALLADSIPAPIDENTPQDSVRAALARRSLARLNAALAAADEVDPALARALKTRLALMLTLEGAGLVPAWPARAADLNRLWEIATDPTLAQPRRGQLMRAWLDALPPGAAWIDAQRARDDASSAHPQTLVRVVNLHHDDQLVWMISDAGARDPDLAALEPGASTVLTLPTPRTHEAIARGVRVGVGAFGQTFLPESRPLPVMPPGRALGPFEPDLRLASLSGSQATDFSLPQTALVLMRVSDARGTRWMLYAECEHPPTGQANDTLTITLGSASTMRSITLSPNATTDPLPGVRLRTEPEVWRAWIEVPREQIVNNLLTLGASRTVLGQRAAYPGPLPPWHAGPLPQVRLDLSAWEPTPK